MLKNKFHLTWCTTVPNPTKVIATETAKNNVFVFEPPSPLREDGAHASNCGEQKLGDNDGRSPTSNPRFQVPTAFLKPHNLFPHRLIGGLRRLISTVPQIIPFPRPKYFPLTTQCNPCTAAKMTRAPQTVDPDPSPSFPLHKFTLDTGGPFPSSVRGFRYINPLAYTYSSVSLLLPSKTKGGASSAVTETLAKWQT